MILFYICYTPNANTVSGICYNISSAILVGHLTHWGRVTHICVGKPLIIGSDNGLSPGWRQAIIWTIAGMLLIGPSGTNFSEILIGIQTFSFKKMHLKKSSAKRRQFCLCLNVLSNPVCPWLFCTVVISSQLYFQPAAFYILCQYYACLQVQCWEWISWLFLGDHFVKTKEIKVHCDGVEICWIF